MNTKWPRVRLGEIMTPVARAEVPVPGKNYRQIGVKLWGRGAYEREAIDGAETKYSQLFLTETNDIIVNKIWARNGSVGVVPNSLAGCYASGEFPMFRARSDTLNPNWMHWLTKTPYFWAQCDEKSQGTSGKNRIRPERFLEIQIPLPPLEEQQRIVAKIEELAAHIDKARTLRQQAEIQIQQMLIGAFQSIADSAPRRPMSEVAPLIRRAVEVDALGVYPEVGVKSFGKGTFHKPPLTGLQVGGKRLFGIRSGDLIFSNVFAWEGAIAIAKPEDEGRFGSHRFITCVPKDKHATSQFLCFYFLTKDGLEQIGEASPGGAGRNRTLGLDALGKIEVPVPDISKQRWFDSLIAQTHGVKHFQAEISAELDALLPSILDKAFKGEL
jgi:type I restriction enzyme S subunit